MPHRNQSATPKVKDIERTLDNTRPFMDDIGEANAMVGIATIAQSWCADWIARPERQYR